MCKYVGLDYGEKTIGVAISQNGRVATGVTTLRRKDAAALRPCLKELKTLLRENGVREIILGFPKNMDGTTSERAEATIQFKEKLERYFKNITVTLWDERLSTRAVSRTYEGKRVNLKKNVDQMAAVYILQGFLDFKNGKETNMTDENFNSDTEDFDDEGDDLVIVTEDGEERPLQILSSREDANGTDIYLLAIEPEAGEVYHFKCNPSESDDEDILLEQIDPEHADYDRVFAMFTDDYEELGIDIEDIE